MAGDAIKTKPNYGFDGSPFIVGAICLMGVACLVAGFSFIAFFNTGMQVAAIALICCGALLAFVCSSYLYYVAFGKLRRRDKMLSMIDWQGAERVLDIGTGRGLLMIGAAKKLTQGKSIGIDIWNEADMHGNTRQNTMLNAELEGVSEKVEVRNEDVRNMSFSNDTFDVIFSNLCLHNVPTKEGREKACREIARVLKPRGVAIITDKAHIKEYAATFADEGLSVKILRAAFDGSLRKSVKAVKNI